MATQMFVNLPVKDLARSKEFFAKLGFSFNPQFTDENAACMVVSDQNFVMLLTEAFFEQFTPKSIADATKSTEVLVALSREGREAVTESSARRSPPAARPTRSRRTTASCTSTASRISTATCGKCSTWIRRRCRSGSPCAEARRRRAPRAPAVRCAAATMLVDDQVAMAGRAHRVRSPGVARAIRTVARAVG